MLKRISVAARAMASHSSNPATPLAASVPRSLLGSAAEDAALAAVAANSGLRFDWSKNEIKRIYDSPLMDLLFYSVAYSDSVHLVDLICCVSRASLVHRKFHDGRAVQQCTLLSIKTGGCSEDCSYCPQSSKHATTVEATKLMKEDAVLAAARKAKEAGSSRFCMGAAWRDMEGRKSNFNSILGYVKEIRGMGMEVCCTLGMITETQAKQLKEAGLTAYNHNLDTSREFYPKIITTRTYDERLDTLAHVRDAGINVCSGGIIGLGESHDDRVGMLHTLATLPEHPESVPVNALLAVEGTPLEAQEPVKIWEMIRMIGTARIVMPQTMIRLSAGRVRFTQPEQAMCFMAGANSIFTGDKLLTTPNNAYNDDKAMFETLGLVPLEPKSVTAKDLEIEVPAPKAQDEILI
ncbi:biotin synthase [Chytriomyces confervae]|uniref:biotin synthase n=1 Tax=Chytriomyces confervae TaxID=246404 RepID=A0A507FGV2_9FUNG|nr:biotin synthase [Chytriomyces confervae]